MKAVIRMPDQPEKIVLTEAQRKSRRARSITMYPVRKPEPPRVDRGTSAAPGRS